MEKLELQTFKLGKYQLGIDGKLSFNSGNIEVIVDKKSALEVMITLLDSMNLLNKEAENLVEEIESRLEND